MEAVTVAPCWSRLGLLWSSPVLERGYQCCPGPSTRRELPHPTSIHHASTIRIHMHPLLHTHAAGIHRSLALLSLADPHRLAARAPWSSYALLLMQEPWLGSLLFYYYEARLHSTRDALQKIDVTPSPGSPGNSMHKATRWDRLTCSFIRDFPR